MGFVADIAGKALGGAVGGVVGSITGSGDKEKIEQEKTTERTIAGASQAEQDRQILIDQFIEQTFGDLAGQDPLDQQKQISNAFQGVLKNFISQDFSAIPSANEIAAAEEFVDKTFTQPAQVQFERFAREFQGAQDVRGAALGRQPDDIGAQAELFGTLAQRQQDISQQRGALVQQQALGLRQQGLQNQLGQVGAAQAGAGFFTSQAQNLLGARLGVLNAATAQQQRGFQERAQNITTIGGGSTTGFTQPSFGTRIGGGIEGAFGISSEIQDALNPTRRL